LNSTEKYSHNSPYFHFFPVNVLDLCAGFAQILHFCPSASEGRLVAIDELFLRPGSQIRVKGLSLTCDDHAMILRKMFPKL